LNLIPPGNGFSQESTELWGFSLTDEKNIYYRRIEAAGDGCRHNYVNRQNDDDAMQTRRIHPTVRMIRHLRMQRGRSTLGCQCAKSIELKVSASVQ
jgi:hypothetical protein